MDWFPIDSDKKVPWTDPFGIRCALHGLNQWEKAFLFISDEFDTKRAFIERHGGNIGVGRTASRWRSPGISCGYHG